MNCSAWSAFRRQMTVGLVIAAGIIAIPIMTHGPEISEQRLFREIMGRMPFRNVQVLGQRLDGGVLTAWGSMVKSRCEYRGLSAYVRRDGLWIRAWVDTTPEDGQRPPGNRSPSPEAQAWGPWSIRVIPPTPEPDRWRIFAHHDCPRGPQTNLFAEGPWP